MEQQMRKSHSFLSLAFLALVLLCGLSRDNASAESAERRINSDNPRCNGSIAECQEELELVMDSDVHARLLEQRTKYINPGALAKDGAACGNGNGQPYDCSAKASGTTKRPCPIYNGCDRPGQ